MLGRGDSRGMSTIIATLLMIILTLVAVGVIWVIVRNVINQGAEEVSLGKFTLNLEVKGVVINPSFPNNLSVKVKRSVGDGDMSGIKFIIEDEDTTEVVELNNYSLKELEEKLIPISLSDISNSSKIKKVSIAPIFKLESGKEVTGDVKDEYEVPKVSGSDIPPCTPNCAGKQCGSNGCTGTCGAYSGGCQTGYTCNITTGQCVATSSCTPATCGTKECGTWANGTCSGTLTCGAYSGGCQTGYTCNITTGQCVVSSFVQSFESSFPPSGWKTGGNASWNRNTTYTVNGSASAASGNIRDIDFGKSWINYTQSFSRAGYVSFYWNVSSEVSCDYLCFCQDKECAAAGCTCNSETGTADARIVSDISGEWKSGFVNWSVSSGNHFFTWCYRKDVGTSSGEDMGIVDNITFIL